MGDFSIIEYYSAHENYRCGYCGSKDTNCSHAMWLHTLTVQDYQDLIDRGWRRSGCYGYKPTMKTTCCPQYTISCHALDFKLTKSHKKTIKRVNNFLNYGTRPTEKASAADDREEQGAGGEHQVERAQQPSEISVKTQSVDSQGDSDIDTTQPEDTSAAQADQSRAVAVADKANQQKEAGNAAPQQEKGDNVTKPGVGYDPSKPRPRKAKELRKERWAAKHGQNAASSPSKKLKNEPKSLEDYLHETVPNPVHKLELRLVRSAPQSDLFVQTFDEVHAVYHRYQMSIHKDPPEKPNVQQFTRFLVNSPFKHNKAVDGEGEWPGYGSFHHQYLLDGKIIAVGVLDLLPYSISSVYLFYDPDYAFLSLGSYSALREVALTRQLQKMKPALKNYYMGFYVHTCPKMNYKANFSPAFLACPKSFTWHPVETCKPLLDQNKYAEFNPKGEAPARLQKVKILQKQQLLPYSMYATLNAPDQDEKQEIQEYATLVGEKCLPRMLLYRK